MLDYADHRVDWWRHGLVMALVLIKRNSLSVWMSVSGVCRSLMVDRLRNDSLLLVSSC